MKIVKVEDAVGLVLSHDVTKIVPGEFKGRLFKKGHVIKEEDIQKLLDIGKEHVYIIEPKEDEVHENDAAKVIQELVLGDGCNVSQEIKEGKIDFLAQVNGVVKIDKNKLFKLNSIGEIIVSTIHNNTPVKKGEKIGSTRVIPLLIKKDKLEKAKEVVSEKIISVKEIKPKKAVLITTGNEVYKGRIKDAFYPVIKNKLNYYGSEIIKQVILPDDKEEITKTILQSINEYKADLIICTGGMSVDPDDVTPNAIKECGAELVSYGSPILPGAMFLLAYYNNIPILGVPSCAMYSKRTVLDLVLPRVLIDEKLTFKDIAQYGHGGLCLDCGVCSFPHCSFGK